ncbi:nischarin [Drosophila persimilis]|uniref:Nischarin n=1 Tax=Drosophila pseudoobscura pseudoobscura TaxID=46245 RepID=A0A6I8UTE3_DROPS|nr:nischarin [Drosophila pseudoobscura]XP_026841601.1 nischarin [Drosophila persimilis]
MACYYRQNEETTVTIPKYTNETSSGGVTYYDIKVRVAKVEWMVERRYRDFAQLHDKLVEDIAISKKLLPPKKLVGNKQPAFLEQRREQLEAYLQELLIYFRTELPRALAEFLDFNKYDIIYLLQDLAKLFDESGDALLSSKKEYNLSALEVFAISERLSLPCPPNVDRDGKYDFSHVLDFCTQLVALVVTPVKDNASYAQDYNTVDVPIGRSNIIPNRLNFNLNAFRNLKTLKFSALSTENIVDIELLKPTLQTICVHNTTIQNICQVLLCDNLHKYCDVPSLLPEAIRPPSATNGSILISTDAWQELTDLDLTGNLLTQIDGSVRTAPKLRRLVLEQNRIRVVQNLDELPHLQLLSLSGNLIAECVDWHLTMGNLVTLELAQNKLKSLKGLRKLLSLVNLDLSCNQIEDLEEVDYVANLPLLESLRLTGNPLAGSVDYRPRVLARFHERAVEISLDNERGSQQELDTALVLSALLQSKQRQRQK